MIPVLVQASRLLSSFSGKTGWANWEENERKANYTVRSECNDLIMCWNEEFLTHLPSLLIEEYRFPPFTILIQSENPLSSFTSTVHTRPTSQLMQTHWWLWKHAAACTNNLKCDLNLPWRCGTGILAVKENTKKHVLLNIKLQCTQLRN